MALPSGYTKLEYIESNGTQYIDTGFAPNGNSRVVMDFESAAVSSILALFGARTSTNTKAFGMWLESGKAQPQYGNVGYNTKPITITNTDRLTYDLNKGVATVGGTTVTFDNLSFAPNQSLVLLSINTNGTVDERRVSGKLYSAKVYDNGTLVRDFIPCKNTSGTIGLWDNVNSVFYANAGTGTFSTGTKHKTLIDGTGYEIKSGRVLIAGTGYDIKKGRTLIDGTGYDIKFATPIGELPAGTIVYMNVDGTRTPYIVVHQGNPDTSAYGASCNGTWVLMRDIYSLTHWQNRQNQYYADSDCILRQVAQSFPSKLDTAIQNNLIPLKLLNVDYSWNDISGDKAFPLTSDDLSNMDYFSDGVTSKRIAKYDGTAADYWLRDFSSRGGSIKYVTATGAFSYFNENSYVSTYKGKGFRPVYILNTASLIADSDFNIIPA